MADVRHRSSLDSEYNTTWADCPERTSVCSLRRSAGGPLGIHRGANRRFWFYGADYRLEDQIAYLNRLRKVTEEELRTFLAGKDIRKSESAAHRQRHVRPRGQNRQSRPEFRILDHVEKVRKAGRNYVTRCPSCAQSGHDRSGDSLAILIDDPRFYKCWASCSREMIRAALGCPVRVRNCA